MIENYKENIEKLGKDSSILIKFCNSSFTIIKNVRLQHNASR